MISICDASNEAFEYVQETFTFMSKAYVLSQGDDSSEKWKHAELIEKYAWDTLEDFNKIRQNKTDNIQTSLEHCRYFRDCAERKLQHMNSLN